MNVVNPMFAAALGSIIRWALALGAGYLVRKEIWQPGDATLYVTAGATALTALVWSLWDKYYQRAKLVTALATPRVVSENTVEKMIDDKLAPPVSVPKDRAPHLEGSPNPLLYQNPDTK